MVARLRNAERFDIGQATRTPMAAFAWLDAMLSSVAVLILGGRRIVASDRTHWWVVAGK